MRTSARLVAVLLFDEVELLDVAGVAAVLGAAGRQWNYRPFKIATVAAEPRLVETRSQLRLEAVQSLEQCEAPEVIVVPGGYGARRALDDARITGWLAAAGARAEHLVVIGHGALLVAKAGLADGATLAAPHETATLFGELAGAPKADTAAPWLESGKIFSARAPASAALAALGLVTKLLGEKQARIVAESLGLESRAVPIEIHGTE